MRPSSLSRWSRALLRRFIGIARIERYRLEIDDGNIIGLFIFAAALMGDVAPGLLADPLLWLGLLEAGRLSVFIFSAYPF